MGKLLTDADLSVIELKVRHPATTAVLADYYRPVSALSLKIPDYKDYRAPTDSPLGRIRFGGHVTRHVLDARGLCHLPVETGRVFCLDVGDVDDEVPHLTIEVGLG